MDLKKGLNGLIGLVDHVEKNSDFLLWHPSHIKWLVNLKKGFESSNWLS